MNDRTTWLNIEMKADKAAVINIAGFIGYPEWWQFDEDYAEQVVSTKEKMRAELEAISNLKADKIEVNIDSYGGDVNHGVAIYNALAFNSAEITVNYTGWSASVATIIGAAGNVVNAPDNFMGLLHEARGGVGGTHEEVTAYAKWLVQINSLGADIYAKKSGRSSEEMLAVMQINNGEGEWKTATELQELGLVDNVLEPMAAAASYEEFEQKANIFNLNKNVKMGLFKKETKTVNSLKVGDIDTVYEGELKAGVELRGIGDGVAIPDMTIESGDNTIVIESAIVKSVTAKEIEMVAATDVQLQITAAVEPLQAELVTLSATLATEQAEKADLQEKYDNLASLRSGHKPPKKDGVNNEADIEVTLDAKIRQGVKMVTDSNVENLNKKRNG